MALKKGEYQAVSLYKFCLCILVVFIHNKTDEYFQLTDKQYMFFEFFTFYIAQIAVPGFMILSAYLLFRGYRTGNAFSKIRSRLSKLAPAYIFWNTVAIPYTVLVTGYRSSGNLIEGILYDLLTSKFNFPLWYIFDLMLFLIFSPVVYKVLKNKNIGIMIIGCLYFLYICGVQLPDIMYRRDVHLYYLLGAYLGIHEFKIYKQRTSLLDMLSGIAGLLLTVILWNSRVKTIALSIYSLGMMRYFLSRFNAKKIPI